MNTNAQRLALDERLAPIAAERRVSRHRIIPMVRKERQTLSVAFRHLGSLRPFKDTPQTEAALDALNQLLGEYVAFVHFSVMKRFVDGEERRDTVRELGEMVYPQVADTTRAALAFCDARGSLTKTGLAESLPSALSSLGKELTRRFQLEDQLLAQMAGDSEETSAPS